MLIVNAFRISLNKELLIVSIVIGLGLFSAIYLYSHDKYSLLYYSDSVSHLVRSRELVDSSNPGLFEQLGTVWLPLPHLLLLPFTLIDLLFKTGFAGLAVSLPSLAITCVFLYKIIKETLGISYIALIGAMLYALNLNILYVSITPMTEALFMLFFVASAYYFQRWLQPSTKYVRTQSEHINLQKNKTVLGYGDSTSKSYDLIKCSVFVSLATLCRYEAWLLPIFLVLLVIIVTVRKKHSYEQKKITPILISLISFTGIALWLIWNAYQYGDALEFARAPYFSAASQAIQRSNRADLYLQPWNVLSVYSLTALATYGPLLLAASFFGYVLHKHFGTKQDQARRKNLYFFLAIPAIFTIISMIGGIGEMNLRQWFNSRFLILLAPLLMLLISIFIARIADKTKRSATSRISDRRKNYLVIGTVVAFFFIYQLVIIPSLGVVTFVNAKYQFGGNRPFQIKAVQALNSVYDGKSGIMIITGSAQQNKIMQLSGIPLSKFDQILEPDRVQESFKRPWLYTDYIIIGKKPDASARNAANYWLSKQDLLAQYFNRVYEDKYYQVLVSKKTNPAILPIQSTSSPNALQTTDMNYQENNGKLLLHKHAFLNITVDNNHVTIPANIGIVPTLHKDRSLDAYGPLGKSPLHTHTATGTIHVESKVLANYTLGEFLNVWGGLDLTNKALKMKVDGIPVTSIQNHILRDKEHINLIVCSTIHSLNPNSC